MGFMGVDVVLEKKWGRSWKIFFIYNKDIYYFFMVLLENLLFVL
jgi:hypothetical protein